MVYKSFQPKKEKKISKKIFIFAVVFFLAIFSIFPSSFLRFSSGANEISIPIWLAGDETTSNFFSFFSSFRSKKYLYQENQTLLAKISTLEQQLSGYDFVVQENLEMRSAFFQKAGKTILARVISRPNVTAYDTLLIDVGENAGIKKGAKIFGGETTIIGVVEEVYVHSSKARLFSTAGQITNVFLGPENIPAEIHGMGGGSFTVDVPSGVEVQEGDSALLAEQPEYIVAMVISKEESIIDSFQKFYLQNTVRLFTLKYVTVEKST